MFTNLKENLQELCCCSESPSVVSVSECIKRHHTLSRSSCSSTRDKMTLLKFTVLHDWYINSLPGPYDCPPLCAYSLEAHGPHLNAFRLLRALQMGKPLLLEGAPGVGKTSLVTALAQASGHHVTRINLSEHTVSLFLRLASAFNSYYMWQSTQKPTISRRNWFRDMSLNDTKCVYSWFCGKGLGKDPSTYLSHNLYFVLLLYERSEVSHASFSPVNVECFYGKIYKQVCGEQIILQGYKHSI